jgi:hypothetical protein
MIVHDLGSHGGIPTGSPFINSGGLPFADFARESVEFCHPALATGSPSYDPIRSKRGLSRGISVSAFAIRSTLHSTISRVMVDIPRMWTTGETQKLRGTRLCGSQHALQMGFIKLVTDQIAASLRNVLKHETEASTQACT